MKENPFSNNHHQPDPREKVEFVRYTEAYKRAQEVKEKRMVGRDLKDFIGGPVYTEAAIKDAEESEVRIKKGFADKAKLLSPDQQEKHERSQMMATCLEGICLYTKSWFGATTKIYPTTDFDDYINGVDLIAERTVGESVNHNGFALDITFGGPKTVHNKVEKIVKRIQNGKLGKVDFFKSEDGRYKGQLNDIPLVIIGTAANTMKGLINHFANPEEDKYLSEHPIQFQIVEDIITQCDFYCKMAEKCEDKERGKQIVSAYVKLKQDFERILALKNRLSPDIDKNFRDIFHENLLEAMKDLENPPETL